MMIVHRVNDEKSHDSLKRSNYVEVDELNSVNDDVANTIIAAEHETFGYDRT